MKNKNNKTIYAKGTADVNNVGKQVNQPINQLTNKLINELTLKPNENRIFTSCYEYSFLHRPYGFKTHHHYC